MELFEQSIDGVQVFAFVRLSILHQAARYQLHHNGVFSFSRRGNSRAGTAIQFIDHNQRIDG